MSGSRVLLLSLVGLAIASTAFAAPQDPPAVRKTARNTLMIDHVRLGADTDDLYVLEVADGDYFQVIFDNSYPACFSYSITATDDARIEAASQNAGRAINVPIIALRRGRVTMQHRDVFTKYRVSATLTCEVEASGGVPSDDRILVRGVQGVQELDLSKIVEALPRLVELRELSFDLWVKSAPKWTVAINGGVAFQKFKSPQYFVKSTTAGGATTRTFEEAEAEEDERPAIMTLISVSPPLHGWGKRLGAAVGFGGQGSELRYYIGGSVSLGGHVVFTAGKAFGFVNAKPLGQEIGQPLVSDNVLANVRSVPASAWYFGFALGFDVKSKPDTITAFSSASVSKPPPLTPVWAFTGTYASENDVFTVSSDGAGVVVRTNTATLMLPVRKENTFSDVSAVQSAAFEMAADGKAATAITLKLAAGETKAPRARALDAFSGKYGDAAAPYLVAVDGSALTLTPPGAQPIRLTRKGNLKFASETHSVVFVVKDDKISALTLNGKELKRIE